MVFDPNEIGFEDVLGSLLKGRGRTLGGYGQYRTAVFPRDAEQMEVIQSQIRERGHGPATERDGVVPPGGATAVFWDAEDYHQKYRLRRNKRFVAAMEKRYGRAWDQYPVATKLNAAPGGGPETQRWLDLLPLDVRTAFQ